MSRVLRGVQQIPSSNMPRDQQENTCGLMNVSNTIQGDQAMSSENPVRNRISYKLRVPAEAEVSALWLVTWKEVNGGSCAG
jgi:hypothetical protein